MLHCLLHAKSAAVKSSQRPLDDRITAGLETWIDEKGFCRTDENLAEVAERIGVSPDALSYYCSNIIGEHFGTFRKRLRLEEAKSLIKEDPQRTLISVAASVGILDRGNFRRQFYELYGYSPSEYRQKCLKRAWRK